MSDDIALGSATELRRALGEREISATELLEIYLARRTRLDGDINAIVTVDEEAARAAAANADHRLAAGDDAPLLGLPMTIKDALATAGMRSTGGAIELANHVPAEDAEAVARVRDAGAVIFGKTNLPRWSGDIQAFNELFGTTNNPWDLTRVPGGSSGGASASVAAGLSAAEIGTDIGGSIRLPAHFAGVCGHKPSFGVVPQLGYISHPTYPLSEPDVNVVGPLARSVDDLELLFDVVAGPRRDLAAAWKLDLPRARSTDARSLRVAAYLDDPLVPLAGDVSAVLEAACDSLAADGVSLRRNAWPGDLAFADVDEVGLPLISAASSPSADDDSFDRLRYSERSQPIRMGSSAVAMSHRDWLLLVERREANRRKWAAFFDHVDVLLAPVAFTAAFTHLQDGTFHTRTISTDGVERPYTDLVRWTSQFGYVGLPATVVPVGLTHGGLPVGLQIVGPHLGDRTTLAFGRHVEAVLGGYQVPPIAA